MIDNPKRKKKTPEQIAAEEFDAMVLAMCPGLREFRERNKKLVNDLARWNPPDAFDNGPNDMTPKDS